MYLAGILIMAWNVFMTIRGYQREEKPISGVASATGAIPAAQPAE